MTLDLYFAETKSYFIRYFETNEMCFGTAKSERQVVFRVFFLTQFPMSIHAIYIGRAPSEQKA